MKRLLVALICAVFTFSTAYAQDAKKKKETVTSLSKEWIVQTVSRRSRRTSLSRKG